MARRLGLERESVYRMERETWRINPEKQERYAHALGLEPEDLWRPPGARSLDGLLAGADDAMRQKIAQMVELMLRPSGEN